MDFPESEFYTARVIKPDFVGLFGYNRTSLIPKGMS